jgi:acylphosphatase
MGRTAISRRDVLIRIHAGEWVEERSIGRPGSVSGVTSRRYLLTVEGIVQGVGYRERVRRAALRLGVRGEVWNESDGTVSIEAEGPEELLTRFEELIAGRYGASDARAVRRLRSLPCASHPVSFEVRP